MWSVRVFLQMNLNPTFKVFSDYLNYTETSISSRWFLQTCNKSTMETGKMVLWRCPSSGTSLRCRVFVDNYFRLDNYILWAWSYVRRTVTLWLKCTFRSSFNEYRLIPGFSPLASVGGADTYIQDYGKFEIQSPSFQCSTDIHVMQSLEMGTRDFFPCIFILIILPLLSGSAMYSVQWSLRSWIWPEVSKCRPLLANLFFYPSDIEA